MKRNHKTLTLEQLKAIISDTSTSARYRNLCIKRVQWISEVRKTGEAKEAK
jgi:hypothetical protein